MLAYNQIEEHDRSEWEIGLAGGKSKSKSSGEARPSEAQRQAAVNKGKRVS